jgi:hypothetical protein
MKNEALIYFEISKCAPYYTASSPPKIVLLIVTDVRISDAKMIHLFGYT